MIKTLINHIKQDTAITSLLSNSDAIFHHEKPIQFEQSLDIDIDNFIVIKDKLIEDRYIKTYQLTFNIVSPSLQKVETISNKLIDYLNDPRGKKRIQSDTVTIRNIVVANGGGIIKNDEGDWTRIVYFLCKI